MTSGSHNSHSLLSPSGAKRWVTCPASVDYVESLKADGAIPQEETSVYAEEGTKAHDYCADILNGLCTSEVISDPDMKTAVESYVHLAESLKQESDTVFIEEKVPLFYSPEDNGTVDFAMVSDDRVYVLDYKHGQGVLVDAKDNPQLAIYAMSLIKNLEGVYDFSDETLVTMTIHQPRTREDVPTKVWALTLKELTVWLAPVQEAANNILNSSDELPFNPSDEACQWCPAKGVCAARQTEAMEGHAAVVQEFFTDETLPPKKVEGGSLTEDEIAHIVLNGDKLVKWINSVQKDALSRVQDGVEIKGLKLIAGRPGNRAWGDEEAAEKLLKGKLKTEGVFEKKLISPSKAEKALKEFNLSKRFQTRFESLITRAEGKPKLTHVSDPNPDIRVDAANEFSEEGGGLLD